MTATKITREELYELVWRTPISRLAAEFGVSDVALAKTCDRLSVPRPGRGYWAQTAAGIKVGRTPLGKAAQGGKAWTVVERLESPAPRPPKPETPKVPVPESLRDASDALRRLGAAFAMSKKDAYGRLVVPGGQEPVFAVTVAAHRRALLVLAALAAAAQGRGHSIAFHEDSAPPRLSLVVGDDVVGIALVERLEQKEHVLTPDEQGRRAKGYTHGIPKHDHFAGGRLQLLVDVGRGTRTSWSDTTTRTLDQQLGAALLAVEREAERRKEQRQLDEARRKEEERRRAAEEEERKLQRAREARAQQRQRIATDLRQMARAWAEAEEVRSFLRAVRETIPAEGRDARTAEWLEWADAYAEAIDPLSKPTDLAKDVECETR